MIGGDLISPTLGHLLERTMTLELSLPIYGILLVVGGIMGFAKAGSKVSLLMGIVGGILSGVAFWLSSSNLTAAYGLGLGLAVILTVVFIGRFRKTQAWMPAGMMAVVSGILSLLWLGQLI